MYSRELETSRVRSLPALYLDYGADADIGGHNALEISDRGMRFESRWQFSIGTRLSVALQYLDSRLGQTRVTVEGIVVWCEPRPDKRHESTLLFLELPDELRHSLREFSHLVDTSE
ncbi:MAG TPA: PilZ domain-containing protein [Chthoniobacteraceae bacterium]